MSREKLAFADLIETLESLKWLSVLTEKGKSGGRKWTLEVIAGPTRFIRKIGCRTKFNGYTLTLKVTAQTAPDDLSEKLGVIDDVITNDMRRGGNAQSTIANEDWTPDEDEGRESFSTTTTIEIQFNEVN